MPGQVYTDLFDVAIEQHGYITTDNARELGIQPKRLVDLKKHGLVNRIATGLYRFNAIPHTQYDQYMEATLWPRGLGVISRETALDLYDVSDINPSKIHLTVPKSLRIVREIPAPYIVHRENLAKTDTTQLEGVSIVTLERAIIECFNEHVRPDLLMQAIRNGREMGQLTNTQASLLLKALKVEAVGVKELITTEIKGPNTSQTEGIPIT